MTRIASEFEADRTGPLTRIRHSLSQRRRHMARTLRQAAVVAMVFGLEPSSKL